MKHLLALLVALALTLCGVSAAECQVRILHFYDLNITGNVIAAMDAARAAINDDSVMLPGCSLAIEHISYSTNRQMVADVLSLLPFDSSGSSWPEDSSCLTANNCFLTIAGVIAASSTQYTLNLHPIIQSKSLFQGSYAASGVVIDSQIIEPAAEILDNTFFRTCPSDTMLIDATAEIVRYLGWTKLLLFSDVTSQSSVEYFVNFQSTHKFEAFGVLSNITVSTHACADPDPSSSLLPCVRAAAMNAMNTSLCIEIVEGCCGGLKELKLSGSLQADTPSMLFHRSLESARALSESTVFVMLLNDAASWHVFGMADDIGLVKSGNSWLNAQRLLTVPTGLHEKARGMICIHWATPSSWQNFSAPSNYSVTAGFAYEAVYTYAHAVTAMLDAGTSTSNLQARVQQLQNDGFDMKDRIKDVNFTGVANPSVEFTAGGNVNRQTVIVSNYRPLNFSSFRTNSSDLRRSTRRTPPPPTPSPSPTPPDGGGPSPSPSPTPPDGGGPYPNPTPTPPDGGGPYPNPTPTPPDGGGPYPNPTPTPPDGGGPNRSPTPTPPGGGGWGGGGNGGSGGSGGSGANGFFNDGDGGQSDSGHGYVQTRRRRQGGGGEHPAPPPPPDGCTDKLAFDGHEWTDSKYSGGKTCSAYAEDHLWCQRTGHKKGMNGMMASEACCACGGGNIEPCQEACCVPDFQLPRVLGAPCINDRQCQSEYCGPSTCSCTDAGAKTLPPIKPFEPSEACKNVTDCEFVQVGTFSNTELLSGETGLNLEQTEMMYTDGSIGVVPPSTTQVFVGVLAPTSVYAATVTAAVAMIQENTTLLLGYTFQAIQGTTDCNVGNAMIEMMLMAESEPVAFVGDGCDSTTLSMQEVQATSESLLIGWGASTPLLYQKPYFVSTSDSIIHYFSGIFEMMTHVGISFVGLAVDGANLGAMATFEQMVEDQTYVFCGIWYLAGNSSEDSREVLDSVVSAASKAVVVLSGVDAMTLLVKELPNSDAQSGYLWFSTKRMVDDALTANSALRSNFIGWIVAEPTIDTNSSLYKSLLNRTTNGTMEGTLDYQELAIFNGLYAIASATTELFQRSIFQSDPDFGNKLMDMILRLNTAGAGALLRFEARGQMMLHYTIFNYNLNGEAQKVGSWDSSAVSDLTFSTDGRRELNGDGRAGRREPGDGKEGRKEVTTSAGSVLVFPGSSSGNLVGLPENPSVKRCSPGTYGFSKYICLQCPAGSESPDGGQASCSLCQEGKYAPNVGTAECSSCSDGATTWDKGTTSEVECMCDEGYYDTAVTEPTFTHVGCFEACDDVSASGSGLDSGSGDKPPQNRSSWMLGSWTKVLGDSDDMDLQLCNSMCTVHNYFGIQGGGRECWCGDATDSDNLANSTAGDQCAETCVGNPNVKCGGQCGLTVYNVSTLREMKQQRSSVCASCPVVQGAFADSFGATCNGGWYQPFAIENFWSDDPENTNFFKCFKGVCEAGSYLGDGKTNGNYTVKTNCGSGSSGRMCSTCTKDHFKRGKDCFTCPELPWSVLLYVAGPVLSLGYFPIMREIIKYTVPSMFVINAYLQICNQFGDFSIQWPQKSKQLLATMGIANFDWNLLMFSCWWRPSFLTSWVLQELLPIFYLGCYFGRHYIYKRFGIQQDRFAVSWYGAVHCAVFIFNLLYLGLTSKTLSLFMCEPTSNGNYYMVMNPSVTCYEGDHLILMIVAILPLFCYTIAWPMVLWVAFYNASRRHLFQDPNFKSIFGFIYMRFEIQWYFWYFAITFQKFATVFIKIFLFDQFVQAPAALALTFFMMSIHSFARPYEAESLDRLQALVYGCQFVYLFLGILMSTERGSTDLADTLEIVFGLVFAISNLVAILYVSRDLVRFWGNKKIAALLDEYDVKLEMSDWSFTNLIKYLRSSPPEEELKMLRTFAFNRSKYPQPAWMMPRILGLAKNAPQLFDYCCDPDYDKVRGTLGNSILYYLSQGGVEEIEEIQKKMELGEDEKEAQGESVMCFSCLNCCSQWTIEDNVAPTDEVPKDRSLLEFWFKENAWGGILYFVSTCTEEERQQAVQTLTMMYVSVTGEVPNEDQDSAASSTDSETCLTDRSRHHSVELKLDTEPGDDLEGAAEIGIDPNDTVESPNPLAAVAMQMNVLDDPFKKGGNFTTPSTGESMQLDELAEQFKKDEADDLGQITLKSPEAQNVLQHAQRDKPLFSPGVISRMALCFERYDLDGSGTINSQNELEQLMFNTYFGLSEKGMNIENASDVIQQRVDSAGNMEANEWNFDQWCAWVQIEFPEIAAWESKQDVNVVT